MLRVPRPPDQTSTRRRRIHRCPVALNYPSLVRIALGLDLYLEEFAEAHDATTFRIWGAGENWRRQLHEVASDPETTIFWNLTEVEIGPGLLRSASELGGGTDWELFQFRQNADWLERTVWFRDGVQIQQPEELS